MQPKSKAAKPKRRPPSIHGMARVELATMSHNILRLNNLLAGNPQAMDLQTLDVLRECDRQVRDTLRTCETKLTDSRRKLLQGLPLRLEDLQFSAKPWGDGHILGARSKGTPSKPREHTSQSLSKDAPSKPPMPVCLRPKCSMTVKSNSKKPDATPKAPTPIRSKLSTTAKASCRDVQTIGKAGRIRALLDMANSTTTNNPTNPCVNNQSVQQNSPEIAQVFRLGT